MLGCLFALLLSILGYAGYRYFHREPEIKVITQLELNLLQPELLLATQNLSELPKDVASAALLSGLVDAQLAFHYEEDEARHSLEGVIRRLAFEHKLDFGDRFIAQLLSEPAQIGFWRGGKGRPEYFIARVERSLLSKWSAVLARIALDDRQLKLLGKFALNGKETELFSLAYGGGRTLVVMGQGDQWVFLSHPGLVLDAQGTLGSDAKGMLEKLLKGGAPWHNALPEATSAKHSFVVGQKALTMDYGRFLSGLTGVRFDFQNGNWQGFVRLAPPPQGGRYDWSSIWQSVPHDTALCVALPVSWQTASAPLETLLGKNEAISPLLNTLDPIAAVCWQKEGRLSAPLFIARSAKPLPATIQPFLASLAEKAWKRPVSHTEKGLYTASVPSRHGLKQPDDKNRAFTPSLAQTENLILFSPDRRQVEAALDVAAKQAPALADEPSLKNGAWMLFDPARLSDLVRSEVQEVLPAGEESFLRDVARNLLWPRLQAWGQQHSASLVVPGEVDTDGFAKLSLQPLRAHAAP